MISKSILSSEREKEKKNSNYKSADGGRGQGTVNFVCGRGNEMGPSHALFYRKAARFEGNVPKVYMNFSDILLASLS